MRRSLTLLVLALSLAAAGCTRAEDADFGKRVRAYLLQHPEVIEEAVQKLQDKRQAEAEAEAKQAMARAQAALPKFRAALERDPRDFVANPAGKITVTEFYDYRCPHCINAAPQVLDIIKSNPDVRFVFKELPIFGAVSEHAARTAIAAKTKGGDYLGLYRSFMSTQPLDDAAIDRLGKAHGVEPAEASAPAVIKAANEQMADAHKLARALSIDGTPTFVIGDTLVPGEDMDSVRAAIEKARRGDKTS